MSWATDSNDNPFADTSASAPQKPAAAEEAAPSWLTDAPAPAPTTAAAPLAAPSPRAQAASDSQPAWASPSGSTGLPSPAAQSPPAQAASSRPALSPEELERGRRYHLYMRVANVVLTSLMCAAAGIQLVNADLAGAVICVYVFFFGLLICCFEAHLRAVARVIADNFGFMYDSKGRFLFMVFVGILCFNLKIFGIIVGAALVANSFVGLYIMCSFPQVLEEELQDLETTLGRTVKDNPEMVAKAGNAAGQWAANNPKQAQQFGTAAASGYSGPGAV